VSGETRADVSAWQVDTLHDHFTELLNEMDKRYEQRFHAQEILRKENDVLNNRALVSALAANEKRLDAMNEFREQLKDQSASFIGRAELMQNTKMFDDKIDVIERRLDRTDGKGEGINVIWLFVVNGGSVVLLIIQTIFLIKLGVK
jgi:hypothetical protein